MSRTLVVALVLAMAVTAGAGIPSADDSYVTIDGGGMGLPTCPAGDAASFGYINVTALRADLTPIQGIPSSSFFFTVTGTGSDNVSINAFDAESNAGGVCRFEAQGDATVPYGSLTVTVQIYTVVVNDSDTLWCNTYDYDDDGDVDPIDFGTFAGDFAGGVAQRSDFDWDGDVDPIDFGSFAGHFGH
mgnify:CR=1 FL=1